MVQRDNTVCLPHIDYNMGYMGYMDYMTYLITLSFYNIRYYTITIFV